MISDEDELLEPCAPKLQGMFRKRMTGIIDNAAGQLSIHCHTRYSAIYVEDEGGVHCIDS